MKRVSLSGKHKSIQWVWDWYEFHFRLLVWAKSQARQTFPADREKPPDAFFGMTPEQIDDYRQELHCVAMLNLLAAAEATIRVDYWNRARKGRKDPVSRHFRDLYRNHGMEVRLKEEILDTWKRFSPGSRRAVGDFAEALKLRNWLAHGRY